MKKLALISVGFIPFLSGYALNHLMITAYYDVALPYMVIGPVFLTIWFLLGMASRNLANSGKEATIFAHLPAFVVLLVLLFQEIVLGRYFGNQIGIATQFYYLPLVNIAGKLAFMSNRLFATYIVAFGLMCGVFYLGCGSRRAH